MFVVSGLLATSNLFANEPPSPSKVDFEKAPKIRVRESTLIKVTVEALEDVEKLEMKISLPKL